MNPRNATGKYSQDEVRVRGNVPGEAPLRVSLYHVVREYEDGSLTARHNRSRWMALLVSSFSVRFMVNIPGDVQGRLFSQLHLDDALVPTCVVGISNLELKRGNCGLQDVGLPLITSPLPILTTKSPRPTDESNLVPRVSSLAGTCLAMTKFLIVTSGLATHAARFNSGESSELPMGQRASTPFKGSRIIPGKSA